MKCSIAVSFLLGSCALCLSQKSDDSHPQVITPLGSIEGFYSVTHGGRRFKAFTGIPYAQPPTGNLRFEIPRRILPWTGVLMAKQFGSPCMQYNFILRDPAAHNKVSGSEDCLYLNVYTPLMDDSPRRENGTSPLNLVPVIFFIHGGAFIFGNGNRYGPKYLLDRNVILVTINYRVGPLGFLSTEDEIVPGNMGLKDQVIALRWVKDNILSFGGDPSRITIIGHSAGGVCAHYHYLTNLTEGLFQGGMSISGTALYPWAQIHDPLQKAKKLAAVVGCTTNNNNDMVDCLRAKPALEIVAALSEFMEAPHYPPPGWGPSIEKGGAEFTFIDRSPVEIIASSDVQDVPWMTSVVGEEALFPTVFYLENEELLESLDNQWEKFAPHILSYNDTIPEVNRTDVTRLIKQHYLGGNSISKATFNQTIQMISDRMFIYDSEKAARSQARANQSPVYAYYFTYRGAHSSTEMLIRNNSTFGACHGDDVRYVLDSGIDPTTTPEDRKMQQVLIDLWVSFATNVTFSTSTLDFEWKALNQSYADDYSYLHIAGPEEIGMKNTVNFREKDFWQTINFQENILPP